MERNLIFCFSGTGNSLKTAKDVASFLGNTEIVLMKAPHKLSRNYNRIGFIFPSYAGGVPKAVLEYIKSIKITADMSDYFFTIITCGGKGRNSLPMLRDALLKKGVSLNYGRELNTVGNYIAMYPPQPDIERALQSANEQAFLYSNEIKENMSISVGKSKFNAELFYMLGNQYFKLNAKKLNVSDFCSSCGTCEKICPTKSINLKNGKPIFSWKTCSQCMACIQWCPKEAINCGKKTAARTRYHHPDIHSGELL